MRSTFQIILWALAIVDPFTSAAPVEEQILQKRDDSTCTIVTETETMTLTETACTGTASNFTATITVTVTTAGAGTTATVTETNDTPSTVTITEPGNTFTEPASTVTITAKPSTITITDVTTVITTVTETGAASTTTTSAPPDTTTTTTGADTPPPTITITRTWTGTTTSATTIIPTDPSGTRTVIDFVTPGPLPDASCNNIGVGVAMWQNIYPNVGSTVLANFDPNHFKSIPPISSTTTNAVGCTGGCLNPYNLAFGHVNEYLLTLVFRGFFYAPVTATYVFRLFGVNDGAYLWLGQKAYTAWNRDNYNGRAWWDGSINYATTIVSIPLTAGSYLPIRIQYADGGGGGQFSLEAHIVNPDSSLTYYIQPQQTTNYLVQFPCDSVFGAPYTRAWGNENPTPNP
ncbi:hypothetical protein ABW20_dc0102393 [Dactylellina cionopaga]|nr:hypothetical protein ABW20_dc0102393 [Dactylellina cionopaga]